MSSSAAPRPNRRPGFVALLFAVLSILVFIGASIWFWFHAPDQVPSHFGPSGQPDDWSSKGETMAWIVPLGVGIPVILSIRWIFEKLPMGLINIPHKEYWLHHGQRDYLFDCLMEFMRITAGACALLFTMVLASSLNVGVSSSWPIGLLILQPAAFILVIVFAMWHLYRRLKPRG